MENIAAASASKKRKLCHDQEDEDNEEEKMEKFYALVKNIREARDRLMSGSYATKEIENNRLNKRSKPEENKPVVEVWKPTFQREDFLEEIDQMKNPHNSVSVAAASSEIKERTGKEEIKEGLDLTLSL